MSPCFHGDDMVYTHNHYDLSHIDPLRADQIGINRR